MLPHISISSTHAIIMLSKIDILRSIAIELVSLLLIVVLLQIELCLKSHSLKLDFFSDFTNTHNKGKLLVYF